MLEVSQSVLYIERASVNVRKLAVTMPKVKSDGARVVWCPRCPRGSLMGRSQGLPPGSDPVPDLAAPSLPAAPRTGTTEHTAHTARTCTQCSQCTCKWVLLCLLS